MEQQVLVAILETAGTLKTIAAELEKKNRLLEKIVDLQQIQVKFKDYELSKSGSWTHSGAYDGTYLDKSKE